MINPNWTKWIERAIYKHFKTNLPDYNVFLETDDNNTNTLSSWLTIRLDVTYKHLNNAGYHAIIPVDILVMHVKGDNLYDAKIITGLIASVFSGISVYDDSDVYQFCLREPKKIIDTYFGETQLQTNMEQATVEGVYEAFI